MTISKRIKIFNKKAQALKLNIPWQLSSWRNFFRNEESFIKAAEKWLDEKRSGKPFARIEDDVDKGLMRKTDGQKSTWSYKPFVWQKPKPEIPEPTEFSAVLEHCV